MKRFMVGLAVTVGLVGCRSLTINLNGIRPDALLATPAVAPSVMPILSASPAAGSVQASGSAEPSASPSESPVPTPTPLPTPTPTPGHNAGDPVTYSDYPFGGKRWIGTFANANKCVVSLDTKPGGKWSSNFDAKIEITGAVSGVDRETFQLIDYDFTGTQNDPFLWSASSGYFMGSIYLWKGNESNVIATGHITLHYNQDHTVTGMLSVDNGGGLVGLDYYSIGPNPLTGIN